MSLRRILIAEDEPDILLVASTILEQLPDVEVEKVINGDQLYNKLISEEYDVLVTDEQMPGRYGLQAISDAKESGSTLPQIMILCTAKGNQKDYAEKVTELEMAGVLGKAYNPNHLKGIVEELLKPEPDREAIAGYFLANKMGL